jgi:hypothetical protein
MTKIAGSGSISQRHGSADPDPVHTKMSWIRNTALKTVKEVLADFYGTIKGFFGQLTLGFLPLKTIAFKDNLGAPSNVPKNFYIPNSLPSFGGFLFQVRLWPHLRNGVMENFGFSIPASLYFDAPISSLEL